MKYGLALGGGGVRGAFQVGVWKALLKMDIELSAVVGTSIGAINGAMIVQGDYDALIRLWRQISVEDIVALQGGKDQDIFSLRNISGLVKDIYKKEGLDMSPLEGILKNVINEETIRSAETDFGIAAFSLTNKKGINKFKNDIPKGQLTDYIMASASILSQKTIGNEKFSDGGMYDNIPVKMLTDKGIRDIIAVDVKGIGISRGYDEAGKNIINIHLRTPRMGIMEFDRSGISQSIDEGYLACLKAFGKVKGGIYCFRADDYMRAEEKYSNELILGLEKAAKAFNINTLEIYTFEGLREMVIDRYLKLRGRSEYDGVFEVIKKSGEAAVIWTAKTLENGNNTLGERFTIPGGIYDAASSILYFSSLKTSSR